MQGQSSRQGLGGLSAWPFLVGALRPRSLQQLDINIPGSALGFLSGASPPATASPQPAPAPHDDSPASAPLNANSSSPAAGPLQGAPLADTPPPTLFSLLPQLLQLSKSVPLPTALPRTVSNATVGVDVRVNATVPPPLSSASMPGINSSSSSSITPSGARSGGTDVSVDVRAPQLPAACLKPLLPQARCQCAVHQDACSIVVLHMQVTVDPTVNINGNVYIGVPDIPGQAASPAPAPAVSMSSAQHAAAPQLQPGPQQSSTWQPMAVPAQGPVQALPSLLAPTVAVYLDRTPAAAQMQGASTGSADLQADAPAQDNATAAPLPVQPDPAQVTASVLTIARLANVSQLAALHQPQAGPQLAAGSAAPASSTRDGQQAEVRAYTLPPSSAGRT